MPTLDNILGNLVNKIPEQKLPDKETCSLISDIFSNLAEAHRYYAATAKGLADVASLVSPEQLTVVLAAAVPPTLQLVLPPGQISPLLAPPPPPRHRLRRQTRKSLSSFVKITSYQTHQIQHSIVVMHVHPQEFWQQQYIVPLKNTCSMRRPHVPKWRSNFVLLQPSCTKLSLASTIRVAHMYIKRDAKLRTQPLLPVKLKRHSQVHLRKLKKRQRHKKHFRNLMTPTQHMTLYHQAALILSIILLDNFRHVFLLYYKT